MMKTRNMFWIALFIIITVGGFWYWQGQANPAGDDGRIQTTGTLEVEEITIASQTGGKIVEMLVDRGDPVEAGEVLVRLETEMLDADLERTDAAIVALQSARDAAYDAWQAALDAQNNPQELELKIAEVQAQLDQAELQVQAAQFADDQSALAMAKTSRDGLQNVLELLEEMRDQPYALIAQVSQAEMFYQGLESLLQVGLSTQELLQLQQEKQTLTAPRSGYIIERALAEGEIAAPLAPMLVLADLTKMTLTIYLLDTEFGQVALGDQAQITVSSLPGQVFTGEVIFISPNAEFTPTNTQTKEDRARLVYAVEISLDNPDLLLKPGMIADVSFGE